MTITRLLMLLLIVTTFYSCDTKTYVTKDYVNRVDSLWALIGNTQEELKSLKQEIITIIDDSTKTEDWQERLTTYIGGPFVLDQNLKDISTILLIQADTIPFFVADTTRPRYIKNYSEIKNTSVLLLHGFNTVVASHIEWFDKVFEDTLTNTRVSITPYINTVKLIDYWEKERPNIKSIGDFEIFRLTILLEADRIIKRMLIQYKLIWTELKSKKLADNSTFHNIVVIQQHKRKRFDGWYRTYNL